MQVDPRTPDHPAARLHGLMLSTQSLFFRLQEAGLLTAAHLNQPHGMTSSLDPAYCQMLQLLLHLKHPIVPHPAMTL